MTKNAKNGNYVKIDEMAQNDPKKLQKCTKYKKLELRKVLGVQGACPLAGFGGAEPLHQCNWKLPRFRASSPNGAWGKAPYNLNGGSRGCPPGGVWRGRAPPPMQLEVAEVQGSVAMVGIGATPHKTSRQTFQGRLLTEGKTLGSCNNNIQPFIKSHPLIRFNKANGMQIPTQNKATQKNHLPYHQ